MPLVKHKNGDVRMVTDFVATNTKLMEKYGYALFTANLPKGYLAQLKAGNADKASAEVK